jgi:hypothetical protein
MSSMATTVEPDLRIGLAAELVEKMDLHPGDELRFVYVGNDLRLVKKLKLEDMFGILKDYPGIADLEGLRDREDEV